MSSPKNEKMKPPPQLSPLEAELVSQMSKVIQLQRIIWLMAQELKGEVLVDEAKMNPLWTLRFVREEVATSPEAELLRIIASQLPEPTQQQMEKLAQLLPGMTEDQTELALTQVGLVGYPPAYIVARLAPMVQCREGKWTRSPN